MTKANLPPGILGKVLKRGTRVLRLAQAKVSSRDLSFGATCHHDKIPQDFLIPQGFLSILAALIRDFFFANHLEHRKGWGGG